MNPSQNDIKQHFGNHEHNPRDGFWGETKQKVQFDLNVIQSIALQDELFGFSGTDNRLATFIHGMAHNGFETLCAHDPEYEEFLPQIDATTGFLKPFGYNGFMNGEFYVTAIEKLLSSWNHDFEKAKQLAHRSAKELIRAQTYHTPSLKLDNMAWHLAGLHETPISIFGIKKQNGWCINGIHRTLLAKHGSIPKAVYGHQVNRYGEENPVTKTPTDDMISRLIDKFEGLFTQIQQITLSAGHTDIYSIPEDIWGKIPARQMHKMIVGDKKAEAYFDYCNQTETVKGQLSAIKKATIKAPIKLQSALPI